MVHIWLLENHNLYKLFIFIHINMNKLPPPHLAKKIKELTRQNQELLDALQELDRRSPVHPAGRKERATFTIDLELMRQFRSYCEKKGWKMSMVVEKVLKKELGKDNHQ